MRLATNRPPTHPGELLLVEFLQPLGMTELQLARAIDVSPDWVNEVTAGTTAITPDLASRLEAQLGASAQFWLNAQAAWDQRHHGALSSSRPRLPGRT
jgi:addiction module HigA family antidote